MSNAPPIQQARRPDAHHAQDPVAGAMPTAAHHASLPSYGCDTTDTMPNAYCALSSHGCDAHHANLKAPSRGAMHPLPLPSHGCDTPMGTMPNAYHVLAPLVSWVRCPPCQLDGPVTRRDAHCPAEPMGATTQRARCQTPTMSWPLSPHRRDACWHAKLKAQSRGMMPTAPPILWVQQPNGHDAQRLSLPGPLLSHGRDAPMLTTPRPGRDAHTPFHSTGAAAPSHALQCANVRPIWVQDTMVTTSAM